MIHRLKRTLWLPVPRKDVFPFFADAANLGRITPPEVRFRFLAPLPVQMEEGSLIRYQLRIFGVPFGWRTRIIRWEPDSCFVDEQIRGPYRVWVHTHRFREVASGTEIEDDVRWALPLRPIGEIAYPLVRWQLDRIFDYRQRAVRAILMGEEEP